MLKKFTPFLALSAFLAIAQSALPATKLEINAQGDLAITGADNQPIKTVSVGSVGQVISADGQSFKLSYGKDLQGALTVIVYPTAEQKKPVELSYGNSSITVSPNAVLTITSGNGSSSLQAGVLGDISVDGKKIPAQSSVALNSSGVVEPQQPVVTTAAATAATTSTKGTATTSPTVTSTTPASAPAAQSLDQSSPNTQSTKIKSVWGNAYISQNGSAETLLRKDTAIKAGDTLRTGEDGELQVSFFPNTFTALDKWSKLTVKELYYSNVNGNPQRKLVAYLESGNVFSKLNTKGNGVTDYEIQTPSHTFKAIGTRFSMQESNGSIIVSVIDGTVTSNDGTPIPSGYKGVFNGTGAPIITPLTSNELFTLNGILNSGDGIHLPGYETMLAELQNAVNGEQQAYMPRLNPQPITPVNP